MIAITTKPNTEPVSTEYPFGSIKDNSGANDGTPVNRYVYSDHHQFFAKLMDAAGLTPNDLLDNATNGFQLHEALKRNIKNEAADLNEWTLINSASITSNTSNVDIESGTLIFHSEQKHSIHLSGNLRVSFNASWNPTTAGTQGEKFTILLPNYNIIDFATHRFNAVIHPISSSYGDKTGSVEFIDISTHTRCIVTLLANEQFSPNETYEISIQANIPIS